MNQLVLDYGTPLHQNCLRMTSDCAFDGSNYYFTVPHERRIFKASTTFQVIETWNTKRTYDCICYDSRAKCFWASSRAGGACLFQLDCSMKETGGVRLLCGEDCGQITGLCYYSCCDQLAVSFVRCALLADKQTGNCRMLLTAPDTHITGLVSLCPSYLLTTVSCGRQWIEIYDAEGAAVRHYALPAGSSVQSLLFDQNTGTVQLFLMRKGGYPFFYRLPLESLGLTNPICCACPTLPDCKTNSGSLRKDCEEALESIARAEAALACLLHKKGEKLQTMIAETADLQTMLCANREINKTIIQVTQLEQGLYQRLQAICEECRNKCSS